MSATMTDILTDGYYRKSFDLQQRTGVLTQIPRLSPEMVENTLTYPWSGADFSTRLWNNKRALLFSMRQTLTQGAIQGQSIAKMSKNLADTMGKSYIVAERLIRTEANHFHSEADRGAYEAAGVEQYEFMATLDNRVSEVCAGLDGKVFDVKDAQTGVNYPPMHPWCRSTTVEHDPEAAADGEPMPDDMDFEGWEEWQEENAVESERTPAKRIAKATSISELTDVMEKITGKSVDLTGTDLELMKKNMEQLSKLGAEYGFRFNSIQTTAARKYLGEVQRTGRYGDIITLNYPKKYYKSKEALLDELKKTMENGDMPKIGGRNIEIYSTTHEFAHTLSSAVTSRLYGGNTDFWDEIEDVYKDYKKNGEKVLGKYASANQDEFLAEAFASAKLSASPSIWAKKTLEIVDKYYKNL